VLTGRGKRRALILATWSVILSSVSQGCLMVHATPYPKGWPDTLAKRCDAIDGTYSNTSDRVPGQRGAWHLRNLVGLLGEDNPPGERIKITVLAPNTLEVSSIRGKYRVPNGLGVHPDTQVRCSEAGVELSWGGFDNAGPEGFGWAGTWVFLSKADDGTLIVKKEHLGLVVYAWVLPLHRRSIEWSRFRPLNVSNSR